MIIYFKDNGIIQVFLQKNYKIVKFENIHLLIPSNDSILKIFFKSIHLPKKINYYFKRYFNYNKMLKKD